ncbi:hypothetical protein M0802_008832 [Mischocyttarus mexicanus]|nr:hypothetical protein M0802_008832 [Mischocyttarus mexicanus]
MQQSLSYGNTTNYTNNNEDNNNTTTMTMTTMTTITMTMMTMMMMITVTETPSYWRHHVEAPRDTCLSISGLLELRNTLTVTEAYPQLSHE